MMTECVLVDVDVYNGGLVSITPYPHERLKPFKFLYYKTDDFELLVVGTRTLLNHGRLLQVYESKTALQLPRKARLGAGAVERDPDWYLSSWFSGYFNLITPEHVKSRIIELLALPL